MAAPKTLVIACTVTAVAFIALVGCGSAPTAPAASGSQVQLFEEAYDSISRYYIEPVHPAALAMAGLGNLAKIDGDILVERSGDQILLHDAGAVTRFAAPDAQDARGWATVTDAVMTTARDQSPAVASLSLTSLDQRVLEGTVGMLDRFSHYMGPEVARERRASRDGFGGIGVSLDSASGAVRIAEVLPDTPAALAGLRVNDIITAIDGVDTATLPREDAAQRLRGPADSIVTLAVTRPGSPQPLHVAMQRARIVPPTVTLKEGHGVAHLRLTSFNQQTAQSLADLLQQAHRDMGSALHGIILDLRGNPGGLLDQSIDVASLFLDGVPVSSTVGRVPESIQYFTAPHRDVERLPLIVLVNGGSASASEIVAAALQDTGRAVVVGSASYGKGTVQNVQRMPNDGELTVTWSRLITPGGYVLHEHGVVPTVCTANVADGTGGVASAVLRSTTALSAELGQARAGLDEAGWRRLRELCPGQRDDHEIEVQAARRLLADPVLYARALGTTPGTARPMTTARMMH
ncbi:MAG TPA: S41 family peptidase [Stellaceae bacterium]|nr:S41 family peptidase [Stellaceae bacterium]